MNMPALALDYVDEKTKHKFHFPLSVFKKPGSEKEYKKQEAILDHLINEVRDNEHHPLVLVMQIIGENLEQFDNENHPPIGNNIGEIEMVQYLMRTNNMVQKDLAKIFGGQANVSKFLNGERTLGKNHIAGLKKQFNISADLFLK